MRTLTIIVVCIGLNGLGFLYRVVGHHRSSAAGLGASSTVTTPTTPSITPIERVSPLTPVKPAEPPGPVAQPTAVKPADQELTQPANQKITEPVSVERHPSSATTVSPKVGQRKPIVVPRPAIVTRPRATPADSESAPAPAKPESKPDSKPENKPDKKSENRPDPAVHIDDSLKKMEANPYKRGE
jgi:hypothetical protein